MLHDVILRKLLVMADENRTVYGLLQQHYRHHDGSETISTITTLLGQVADPLFETLLNQVTEREAERFKEREARIAKRQQEELKKVQAVKPADEQASAAPASPIGGTVVICTILTALAANARRVTRLPSTS